MEVTQEQLGNTFKKRIHTSLFMSSQASKTLLMLGENIFKL